MLPTIRSAKRFAFVWVGCSVWPSHPQRSPAVFCPPVVAGGGNWGSWNHWSLCSKTCDSGWQRRFRLCEATGLQGYPCDGSGEEVRSCNEKKCPGQ